MPVTSATATYTATAVNTGNDGQVLMADSTSATNLGWSDGAVGEWVDGGNATTLIGATTTAPTFGTLATDTVQYRQLGPKTWEVLYKIVKRVSGGSNGTGSYLFTLPNSLEFVTSLALQQTTTASGGNTTEWLEYTLPGSTGAVRAGTYANSDPWATMVAVAPYSSTSFRVVCDTSGSSPQIDVLSGAHYQVGSYDQVSYTIHFTFQTA
jgi:hypothetical protein